MQTLEKGRISSIQLSLLVITLVVSTADVFLPSFVAQESGRDSWLAVIAGSISALVIINIYLFLGLKFKDMTLVQYSCVIAGKWPGKAIGVLYIYFYLFLAYTVVRELGEIFVISFNPSIPLPVISAVTLLVSAYAVVSGLEVLSRINELMIVLGMLVLAFIAVINIPNLDFRNLFPMLYDGVMPVLRGSTLIQSWILETVLALQLIPFTKDTGKIRRNTLISVIVLFISLEVGVLTIAVFGPLTGKLVFPALEYVRYATLGPYIQNLDISIIAVWVSGIFIKVTLFYYLSVLSITQLLGLKSYRNLVIPVGVLITVMSLAAADRLTDLLHFLHFIFPFYIFTMTFIIPVLLLIVSAIRKKGSGKPAA